MRILVVSQYFHPEAFRVNDVVRGLIERRHDVTVLTGQPNYEGGEFFEGYSAFSPRYERLMGADIHRVPLVARGGGTGSRLALNYLTFALSSSILAPVILKSKFDAIIVYQMSPVTMAFPAFVLKKLRNIPVLFWVQDLWPETLRATGKVHSEQLHRWMGKLVGGMYRASDMVLVESEAFLDAIRETGLPSHRVAYLPEWAESFYRPCSVSDEAKEAREMPSGFKVVFAGNIGVAQSMETILDAALLLRDHKDIRWVFIGDGRRKEWAEQRVADLNLQEQVVFLGRRPPTAMPRYLALGDVLLVTLRSDPAFAMTIPAKLQSYLACGRPVVAALDGEGARVVLAAGAGLACASEDAKGLADAIQTMYEQSPQQRAQMGRAARRYYLAHFERESLLDQLEEFVRTVVQSGSVKPVN